MSSVHAMEWSWGVAAATMRAGVVRRLGNFTHALRLSTSAPFLPRARADLSHWFDCQSVPGAYRVGPPTSQTTTATTTATTTTATSSLMAECPWARSIAIAFLGGIMQAIVTGTQASKTPLLQQRGRGWRRPVPVLAVYLLSIYFDLTCACSVEAAARVVWVKWLGCNVSGLILIMHEDT